MAGVKLHSGGKRAGAGRKPKADEEKAQALSLAAIIKVYGGEVEGFERMLASGDTGLIKWVFEHAYGKPKEKVEMKHEGGISIVFKKAHAGS